MTNPYAYRLDITIPHSTPESLGFKWDKTYQRYIYRFTVWRLSETATVYCELQLDMDGHVELGVFEAPKTYYGPYLLDVWMIEQMEGHEIIWNRINIMLKKLGIVEDYDRFRMRPQLKHMKYYGPEKKEVHNEEDNVAC